MDAEFDTLDGKIDQFLQLCQRLKSENRELRLQLVSAQNDVKLLRQSRRRQDPPGSAVASDAGMSTKPKTLDVSIMGRSYRVTCADDEREALLAAVAYVDKKMTEIKAASKVAGTERIAVMAALNIANELLSIKLGSGFDIAELKRRMNSVQSKLDQALSQQDSLF
jgi:cell division protein ZapA